MVDSKIAEQAIASLPPLSLHPQGMVSIYAMDCEVLEAPTDTEGLKRSVGLVLQPSETRRAARIKRSVKIRFSFSTL